MPATDAMLMTLPPCSCIHASRARRIMRSGASTFVSSTFCTTASSASRSGPNCGFVAALFTRMSKRPDRSMTVRTIAADSSCRPT